MTLEDLRPLPERIPLVDVPRTTIPFDDIPRGPGWMVLVAIAFDLLLWALIIAGGLWLCGLVAEVL